MPRNDERKSKHKHHLDDDITSKILGTASPDESISLGDRSRNNNKSQDGDILNSAFVMVNDIGKLDPKGLEGFSRAFKEQIKPPTKIVDEFKDGVMNLAGSATTYIFCTIFVIAAVIILCLGYVGVLSWTVSIIIIIILGLLVLLMASLLYNRVSDYLGRANKELTDHIADYTGGVFGDVTNALKAGLNAYASERTIPKEELVDPLDSMLFD